MSLLNALFVESFAMMATPLSPLEAVIGGPMAGVMYPLVALGFVLIFKASGVLSFAQGAMVPFAALDYGRKLTDGPPDEVRSDRAAVEAHVGVVHG